MPFQSSESTVDSYETQRSVETFLFFENHLISNQYQSCIGGFSLIRHEHQHQHQQQQQLQQQHQHQQQEQPQHQHEEVTIHKGEYIPRAFECEGPEPRGRRSYSLFHSSRPCCSSFILQLMETVQPQKESK